MDQFPRPLQPVTGPFPTAQVHGAVDGMGEYGPATRALVGSGYVQPDLLTGMTLTLLEGQPRKPRADGSKKPAATAGRVWVREQFTIHRPLPIDDAWRSEGETTGSYTKKGRSYSTTASRSTTSQGTRFATNLTTGLLSYRPDPEAQDSVQGLALEDTLSPSIDWDAAASNPHRDELRNATTGDVLGGESVLLSLAMMRARATDKPGNPIHSDPEQAKKAGLAKPIAGGSHVLSFALEPIMAAFGNQVLLHGANFDVRWRVPTENDVSIVPTVSVTTATDERVDLDVRVDLDSGPTAMVATIVIPIR